MKTSDRQLAALAECDRHPPVDPRQTAPPRCDMKHGCMADVTHIDSAGYVYCTVHGLQRRTYEPCRKLRPHEIKKLQRGEALQRY